MKSLWRLWFHKGLHVQWADFTIDFQLRAKKPAKTYFKQYLKVIHVNLSMKSSIPGPIVRVMKTNVRAWVAIELRPYVYRVTSWQEQIDNSSKSAAYQLFRARFIIADDRKQEKTLKTFFEEWQNSHSGSFLLWKDHESAVDCIEFLGVHCSWV